MRPLQNLHDLKADMEKKDWGIDSFPFRYKKNFIVLVTLFGPDEPRDRYALVQLKFLWEKDFTYHLSVPANAGGLMMETKDLRHFFRIEYAENLGDILQQFSLELGCHILKSVNPNKSKIEKDAIVHTLSKKDCEDPSKIYCYAVRRNPVVIDNRTGELRQLKRNPYNDNKTRLLRRKLYNRFAKDDSISFCYSDDPEKSHTDEEIISNWTARKAENESGMAVL